MRVRVAALLRGLALGAALVGGAVAPAQAQTSATLVSISGYGNFHAAGSVATRALAFQSLARFQVLLAATYSGAFHPTAEGHAAIADSVAERARAVLKKYGQQSTAALAR